MRLHTLFPGACMFVKGSSFIKDTIISATLTRVIRLYQFQDKLRAEVQLVSVIELSPSDKAFVVYQEKIRPYKTTNSIALVPIPLSQF